MTSFFFSECLNFMYLYMLTLCYIRYLRLTRTVVFNQETIIDLLLYHKELLFMNANYVTLFQK